MDEEARESKNDVLRELWEKYDRRVRVGGVDRARIRDAIVKIAGLSNEFWMRVAKGKPLECKELRETLAAL